MKKNMPLEGLRWSRDSGSALCDTSQNSRSRTGWGGVLLFILDFIIVLFLSTNYDLYYCTSTYFYSKVIFVFKSFPHSFYYYIPPMT